MTVIGSVVLPTPTEFWFSTYGGGKLGDSCYSVNAFQGGSCVCFQYFLCFLVFAVLHLYVLLRDVAVLSI